MPPIVRGGAWPARHAMDTPTGLHTDLAKSRTGRQLHRRIAGRTVNPFAQLVSGLQWCT
jgi:hypothetical protein